MSHAWTNLPSQLESAVPQANKDAQNDGNLQHFVNSEAITDTITFGIKSSGSDDAILADVSKGKVELRTGKTKDALFTLVAKPEQWQVSIARKVDARGHQN